MEEYNEHSEHLKKRMIIMLSCLGVLFGAIFIYKTVMGGLMKYGMSHQSHAVTVSSMKVSTSPWQSQLKAVGSVRAVRGVNVTTELAGMVETIYFTPGSTVQAGAVLVQLNIDTDVAQLHALQAQAELASITYKRDKLQYAAKAVSKETLDTDAANEKNLQAQVAAQIGTIGKKIIQAPFSGRLGISAVNPGQYVNPGDKVVTLQQLDPIYVDFYVPQQDIVDLKMGATVTVSNETFPGKVFTGTITTIDPIVDVNTRNVEVEATFANPKFELIPGMFTTVTVTTGKPQNFITLPQTAITFNPYGSLVYLIKSTDSKKGKSILTVEQSFVTTGETRGEQVAILKGLQVGDEVVTSGQLKLKNGSEVVIDNSVAPSNNPAPVLSNEH